MEQVIKVKDLQELFNDKQRFLVTTLDGHQGVSSNSYHYNGVQGEYDEEFRFYKHPGLPEGIFMRETYHTDSYGDNKTLVKIEFVKGKEKTVTVYEPV